VSARARALPAWTITAAFALAYVIVAPPSSDLAAAGYRSDLFARAGLTLWDNGWYGGHHLLGYSLLAPGLGALVGVQLLAALSSTAAVALFAHLLDGRAPARAARAASLWFALGAAISLLTNRVAFELGVAVGLAALVVACASVRSLSPVASAATRTVLSQAGKAPGGRRRALAALALAALCSLASPVAGAFLALCTLAWALTRARERRLALAMTLAALAPLALLALAFPEGGSEPFAASAFYPALAAVLALAAALWRGQRLLRTGLLLYALALIGAYVLATPVGGNAVRLGALFAGPLLALAVVGRQRNHRADGGGGHARARAATLVVLALALGYWQLRAPIADYASAASNPTADASFYRPLLAQLRRMGIGYGARPARIEVVPTRNHGEARWVADRVALARGWQRQLERDRYGLFFEGAREPSAARYRAWLGEQAISYVALADAPLDYSGRGEARVVAGAPSYLREVWRSAHWRLFAVRGATPLAQPPSVLTRLDDDAFTLRASAAGTYVVRVRFTPYWALADGHGCVSRAGGDWTRVQTHAAGSVRVAIDFSLARVFAHGARCR
jgi:MFS family permease